MQSRLEVDKILPDALRAVLQVQTYINHHSAVNLLCST